MGGRGTAKQGCSHCGWGGRRIFILLVNLEEGLDWAVEMSNAMSRRNLRISAAANTNEFSSIFSDGGCHVLNSDSKEVKLPEEFSMRPCEGVGTEGKRSIPLAKHPSRRKRCSKTIKPDLQKKHEGDE